MTNEQRAEKSQIDFSARKVKVSEIAVSFTRSYIIPTNLQLFLERVALYSLGDVFSPNNRKSTYRFCRRARWADRARNTADKRHHLRFVVPLKGWPALHTLTDSKLSAPKSSSDTLNPSCRTRASALCSRPLLVCFADAAVSRIGQLWRCRSTGSLLQSHRGSLPA